MSDTLLDSSLLLIPALLLTVAMLPSFLPARRAASIDLIAALRPE